MKRFIFSALILLVLSCLLGYSRETITETGREYGNADAISTNIIGGSLSWTNPLIKPSRLMSISYLLPASSTCTMSVDHVSVTVNKSKTVVYTTNNFFSPAVIETNYFPAESVVFVTNRIQTIATTNIQSVLLDAGISGDLPEYYTVLGGESLKFTFSATNNIPLKWVTRQ